MGQEISRRQLFSLGAVIVLAPALRIFPAETARLAGRAAWLTPLLALPPLLGWAKGLSLFLEARREGEQFPDLLLRLGGPPALVPLALWALVYTAFVLRSGADRLVGTVYVGASPAVFTQLMGLLALWAALSTPRTLVRVGRMLLPLLLGTLLLLLGFACFSADANALLPLTADDLLPALRGLAVPLDVICGAGTALCFLAGGLRADRRPLFPALALWAAGLCALLTALGAVVTGVFGAPLAAALYRPFFVLVRTLVLFRSAERMEALVIMLWLFPDFLTSALFLWTAQYSLRLLFGFHPDTARHARADLTNGRWLIWVCGTAAAAAGIFLAPTSASLERWSITLIPAINFAFVFGFLPVLYMVGRRRGKETPAPEPEGA